MLGQISSAFVDDETFLQTIFTADEADIRISNITVLRMPFRGTIFRKYVVHKDQFQCVF